MLNPRRRFENNEKKTLVRRSQFLINYLFGCAFLLTPTHEAIITQANFTISNTTERKKRTMKTFYAQNTLMRAKSHFFIINFIYLTNVSRLKYLLDGFKNISLLPSQHSIYIHPECSGLFSFFTSASFLFYVIFKLICLQ